MVYECCYLPINTNLGCVENPHHVYCEPNMAVMNKIFPFVRVPDNLKLKQTLSPVNQVIAIDCEMVLFIK